MLRRVNIRVFFPFLLLVLRYDALLLVAGFYLVMPEVCIVFTKKSQILRRTIPFSCSLEMARKQAGQTQDTEVVCAAEVDNRKN